MNYIVADDLTGAADTGIQFQSHGIPTVVVVDSDSVFPEIKENLQALSINVNTRALNAQEAYLNIFNTVKKLKLQTCDLLYKKVDSTLRGNCAEELDAVLDASGRKIALVAPSYPAMGRKLKNGILKATNGFSRDARALFHRSKYPVRSISLDDLRENPDRIVEQIKAETNHAIFLFDAETDNDLTRVARLSKAISNLVYCGSAGLAAGLLGEINSESAGQRIGSCGNKSCASRILVVSGSRKKETADQIRRLQEECEFSIVTLNTKEFLDSPNREAIIRCSGQRLAEPLESTGHGIALVFNSLFESQTSYDDESATDKMEGSLLANALGQITHDVQDIFDGFILIGGDTALGVCKALGASSIKLCGEISSGVISGYLVDGAKAGNPVVTKSGAFGSPDVLTLAVNWMQEGRIYAT